MGYNNVHKRSPKQTVFNVTRDRYKLGNGNTRPFAYLFLDASTGKTIRAANRGMMTDYFKDEGTAHYWLGEVRKRNPNVSLKPLSDIEFTEWLNTRLPDKATHAELVKLHVKGHKFSDQEIAEEFAEKRAGVVYVFLGDELDDDTLFIKESVCQSKDKNAHYLVVTDLGSKRMF
jgi:hypothetical protein